MSKQGQITDKQERFCQEYTVDYNGAQAAIRAGYSQRSAKEQAARLLTNDNVVARIAELREKAEVLTTMSKQDLLNRLEELTKADKDSDAIRATEIYMKHRGMLDERSKVEHSGDGFVIEIVSAKDAK